MIALKFDFRGHLLFDEASRLDLTWLLPQPTDPQDRSDAKIVRILSYS